MVTGTKKIQEICDLLKKETLEPAKQEAKEILENAKMQAQEIVENAKKEALLLKEKAKKALEQEKAVFDSSLSLAARQSVERLKQDIEENLFNKSLDKVLGQELSRPEIIAKILTAIITAIQKEGTDADVTAYIAKGVDARKVNELIGQDIKETLREKEVRLGSFDGGVQIKLHKEMITIDISEKVVNDLLREYLVEDFRVFFFHP